MNRAKREVGITSPLQSTKSLDLSSVVNNLYQCDAMCTVNNYSPLQALYRQMHSSDKIQSLKRHHLLKVTLHSKANACNKGTFIRFYMQMRVEKTKAFVYRIYCPFTQQCIYNMLYTCFVNKLKPLVSLFSINIVIEVQKSAELYLLKQRCQLKIRRQIFLNLPYCQLYDHSNY